MAWAKRGAVKLVRVFSRYSFPARLQIARWNSMSMRTESLVERLRSTDDPARLYEILTNAVPSQNAA